jgi:hypothetical protein
MSGRNDLERAYANMYSSQLNDLFDQYAKVLMQFLSTNKSDGLMTLLTETVPTNLRFFENRLIRNNGFLAGTELSYADLHLSALLDLLNENKSMVLMSFPNVSNLGLLLLISQLLKNVKLLLL